jgi:hypothetical protein
MMPGAMMPQMMPMSMFAAMSRASSGMSRFAADRLPA